ncbi:phosphopantetheine-binding protein, partial [Kibdelosporangium philippinense]
VKIRGFRVELGEIENALLRVPGVRDAAAVVTDGTQRLVAFYSGPQPLDTGVVADQLGKLLPGYMVPSALIWQDSLPLTANGKIARTILTTLAGQLDTDTACRQEPSTPAERRLAAAWATVLGVPLDQIGRRDHFFERGGTSLSAVQLVTTLDREMSLTDVTRHPVLADLAALLDRGPESRPAQPVASSSGGSD